jgi:hypothetical protein
MNWAGGLIIRILLSLLPAITPVLRDALREFVSDLRAKAQQTESPIDDAVVSILEELLSL